MITELSCAIESNSGKRSMRTSMIKISLLLASLLIAACTAKTTATSLPPTFNGRIIVYQTGHGLLEIKSDAVSREVKIKQLIEPGLYASLSDLAELRRAVSPDKRYLIAPSAVTDADTFVALIDLQTDKVTPLKYVKLNCLSWSPDSSKIMYYGKYRYDEIEGLFVYDVATTEYQYVFFPKSEKYTRSDGMGTVTIHAPTTCGRESWVDSNDVLFTAYEAAMPGTLELGRKNEWGPHTTLLVRLDKPENTETRTEKSWLLEDTCDQGSYLKFIDGEKKEYFIPSFTDFASIKGQSVCNDCNGAQFIPRSCDLLLLRQDAEQKTLQVSYFDIKTKNVKQGALLNDVFSRYSLGKEREPVETLSHGVWVGDPQDHVIAFVNRINGGGGRVGLFFLDLDTGTEQLIPLKYNSAISPTTIMVTWLSD